MPQKPDKNSAKSRKFKLGSRHRQITAADLVSRLPLSKSLNASQSALVALSPLFYDWMNHPDQQLHLSEACRNSSNLESFRRGQLNITCPTASHASELKHLQESLKNYLNSTYCVSTDSGDTKPIDTIKIRVDLLLESRSRSSSSPSSSKRRAISISNNSIDALNSCSRQVNNPDLADALNRLAQTLREESSTLSKQSSTLSKQSSDD